MTSVTRPPKWPNTPLAKARIARCPECGHDRETKAQPRTVLRCPNCSEHYLAPPLDHDPGPPPEDEPLPVASDEEMAEAGLLGPEVVRVESVDFPTADPHPVAAPTPENPEPPEVPEDAAPAPVPPPADPPPSPTEDPAGSPRPESPPRRRRRRYAGRW